MSLLHHRPAITRSWLARVILAAVAAHFALPDAIADPKPPRAIIAPSVGVLHALVSHGISLPRPCLAGPGGFVGALRFRKEIGPTEVKELESLGVSFARRYSGPGDVDHAGTVYPAFIEWARLDRLARFPGLVQIDSEPLLKPIPPLDVTGPLVGAPALGAWVSMKQDKAPGEGVKVADLDSGVDAYHPALFRPDGGFFAWVDANGDGKLTFGTDAVDLDGDGLAGTGETVGFMDVALINFFDAGGGEGFYGNGKFDLGQDWIYVDLNGNGARDRGVKSGFGDGTPAFGEPLFLPDDVDGDGVLDPEEKLVALKTSKFAKVLVKGKEYVRGANLSLVDSDFFGTDQQGLPAALHGTGVAGIMAANWPGMGRFVGMAPGIDIFTADYSQEDGSDWESGSSIEKVIWAEKQGVAIMLHEYASWGLSFMDGTDALDKAIEAEYVEHGILQAIPTGNLAEAGKHMQAGIGPGPKELHVDVPVAWPDYDMPFETPALILSFYWKGGPKDVKVRIRPPTGTATVECPDDWDSAVELPGTNMLMAGAANQSESGWSMFLCYIVDSNQWKVNFGEWLVTLDNTTQASIYVHGYVNDVLSGWSRVVTFKEFESMDTTLCNPATSGGSIGIGAYGGEFGPPEELGMVRGYSSRGPRMDGPLNMHVVAPDDPYTALADMDLSPMGGPKVVAGYMVFGGTSGAGPHVAGTLALLKQLEPDVKAPELLDKLIKGTETGPEMGELPNKAWGFGRLNVYKAALGELPDKANKAPMAKVELAGLTGQKAKLDASASSDPEGKAMEFRWDFDYDGVWDTPWGPDATIDHEYPEPVFARVKVAVRDPHGAVGSALAAFKVGDPKPPEPKPEPVDTVEQKPEPVLEEGVEEAPPEMVEEATQPEVEEETFAPEEIALTEQIGDMPDAAAEEHGLASEVMQDVQEDVAVDPGLDVGETRPSGGGSGCSAGGPGVPATATTLLLIAFVTVGCGRRTAPLPDVQRFQDLADVEKLETLMRTHDEE